MKDPHPPRDTRTETTLAVWWLLFAVALAVAVPLSVMAFVTVRQMVADQRANSREDLRVLAQQVANRLDDLVREHHAVLNVTAHTVRSDAGDMRFRDSLLVAIAHDLPPYIRTLSIYDPAGVNLGHTFSFGSQPRAVIGDRRYFREAVQTRRFAVGDPIISRLTGRRVIGVVLPVLGRDSSVVAVTATTIELDHLLELLALPQLPEHSVVTVIDTAGVVVARSIDAERWIGRNVRTQPGISEVLARRSGEGEYRGLDSVNRYAAYAPTVIAPWIVTVGFPTDVFAVQARERMQRGLVIVFFSLLGGLALAGLFARRIGVPIARLMDDALALGHGESRRRADISTAGPVRPLAVAFNRMAEELENRARETEASRRAAQESEAQYRVLTEGIPILLADVDASGDITYVNQACVEFAGRERDALIGTAITDLFPADSRSMVAERARAAMDGTAAAFDMVLDRGDGTTASCLVSFVPRAVRGNGAAPQRSGLLVLISDVTQRVELESQLRHSQKMEAVGQLAGGIAHDFNNLLTVILSHVSFAATTLKDRGDVGDVPESLSEISAAGGRAAELTRQLLTFARRQQLTPQVVDLNEITKAIDRLLRRVLGEHIELVTQLAPSPWSIEADPNQIEQILINLAVNARDAMPEGGRLTIETSNEVLGRQYVSTHTDVAPGEYVMVAVSDTGTGMSPEHLARIFEPFFTTKPLGAGTGLGLAVCYGIAKQHGGHIAAYSELGHGSTFRLYLPRTRRSAGKESDEHAVVPARGTETILLVEDTASVRSIAERALRAQGYEVLTAEDGVEALRVSDAHRGRIDLVLTDIVMPRMGGRDLVIQLLVRRPGTRVLYTSGYTARSSMSREDLDPSDPFLAKPYVPESLLLKVREVLDA